MTPTPLVVGEDVPEEMLLGRLATYTSSDAEVSQADFAESWGSRGLNVDDLPEARGKVHVFQSACASVRTRRGSNGSGEKIEVHADEIEHAGGRCAYQITMAVWDLAHRAIEHEKAMRVNFDGARITVDQLGDKRLGAIEQAIRAHYRANTNTVPGQKVRNAVRQQLLRIGAQNVRGKAGGLYFVPVKYRTAEPPTSKRKGAYAKRQKRTKPVLDALAGVLKDLYGTRADFYSFPVGSDEEIQEMVRKHFVINANEKALELATKATNRVRAGAGSRGVRKDMLDNLYNDRRELLDAIDQYKALVSVEETEMSASLRTLDHALGELQKLRDEGSSE